MNYLVIMKYLTNLGRSVLYLACLSYRYAFNISLSTLPDKRECQKKNYLMLSKQLRALYQCKHRFQPDVFNQSTHHLFY